MIWRLSDVIYACSLGQKPVLYVRNIQKPVNQ